MVSFGAITVSARLSGGTADVNILTGQLHVAKDRRAEEQRTACNPARHSAFLQTDSSCFIFVVLIFYIIKTKVHHEMKLLSELPAL